jgi:hypothetical protein
METALQVLSLSCEQTEKIVDQLRHAAILSMKAVKHIDVTQHITQQWQGKIQI